MRLATAVPAVAMFLVAAGWQPAWGGHGTIEETDDQIIVEYSGDPGDNATPGRNAAPSSGATPSAAPDTISGQAPTPAGGNPEATAASGGTGDESPRRLPRSRNTRRPRSGGGAVPMPAVEE
ncbi:hypothetical protein GMSM_36490 [Geomonas sp. Red276]